VRRLDAEQRSFLEETCQAYEGALNEEALSYLHGRGLDMEAASRFRLGLVADPPAEHRIFDGRLAIPIIKRVGVVAFKFKCINRSCLLGGGREKHEGHAKYLKTVGDAHLYNTLALDDPSDTVELCEGEFDTMILSSGLYLSSIGIPGVNAWKAHPHWVRLLKGCRRIRMWADNDASKPKNHGHLLAEQVMTDLPQTELVLMPNDMDVTETYLNHGPGYLLEAAGM
jgi:hypothetical protein